MSDFDNKRPDPGGGGYSGGDVEEDGGGSCLKDDQRKSSGQAKKAKRVSIFRFRKVKNQLLRRRNRPSYTNPGCFDNRRIGGRWNCLCIKQTPTLDSPVESQTSDPNDSEFTFELLRALIEKNDFYSKECNTHLDIDSMSTSNVNEK